MPAKICPIINHYLSVGAEIFPLVANMDYGLNLPFLLQKAFTDVSTVPSLRLFCKR